MEIIEGAEISIKYEGYINREKLLAEKLDKFENIYIEDKFNYDQLKSISTEARQKLEKLTRKQLVRQNEFPVFPHQTLMYLIMLGR